MTNPYAEQFRKIVNSTGIAPPPPPKEVVVQHEVVKHDFVTRRPYLWFGLLVGFAVGTVLGIFF